MPRIKMPYHQRHHRQLAAALRFPRMAAPGTQWVYHTSDTFVLTQAMQAYLQTQTGAEADIFNLVRDEVSYIPAGLSAGALTTQRTGRLADGAPIGGFGLFLTVDDTAKMAQLLNQDRGQIGGVQVLEPTLLAAALQQNPADRGLPTSGNDRYNASFWARSLAPFCDAYVPYMSGYGGITVALLPNGADYYYFSDNGEYVWGPASDCKPAGAPVPAEIAGWRAMFLAKRLQRYRQSARP